MVGDDNIPYLRRNCGWGRVRGDDRGGQEQGAHSDANCEDHLLECCYSSSDHGAVDLSSGGTVRDTAEVIITTVSHNPVNATVSAFNERCGVSVHLVTAV